MEQLFFYKNFGRDIFHCETCGNMTVIDKVEDKVLVYRASDDRNKPADVLASMALTPERAGRIRHDGECPVCAAWTDDEDRPVKP